MADSVKFLSEEITLGTTANNISSASLVRVVNLNSGPAKITQKLANGTTIAAFTLTPVDGDSGSLYVIKQPTETLQSNLASNVVAASVGYY